MVSDRCKKSSALFFAVIGVGMILIGVILLVTIRMSKKGTRPSGPPSEPRNIRFDPVNKRLSWTSPEKASGKTAYIVTATVRGKPPGKPIQTDRPSTAIPGPETGEVVTYTVQAKNEAGLGPPGALRNISGCPASDPWVYGDMKGGFYCCSSKENVKGGRCEGACCIASGSEKGCQGAKNCGLPDPRSCPSARPWMSGTSTQPRACHATKEGADANAPDSGACCLSGECGAGVKERCPNASPWK